MPYFIYRITPENKLTNLGSNSNYRQAKEEVRQLRKSSDTPGDNFRLMFASSEAEAEKLLLTPREEPVQGDD